MVGNEREEHGAYVLLDAEQKLKQGIVSDHVVDSVDTLLCKAIAMGASDVHLQPDNSVLRVRLRVDGVLHDHETFDHELMPQVLSRVKILAALDIAEKRVPQDGKIKVILDQPDAQPIDLRVATFPSIYGEKIVVRILDRAANILALESLGMRPDILKALTAIADHPQGFFLVTGPTGSGKTTTLYALLSRLNSNERNIVTMEDPVEYDLPGITQSQVNSKTGFDFENGLRSMLRQDPDVIMIGEIRDKQTVQIAVQSALTGHLVLSTLHTNDAAGAVTRLLDMQVEPFLINATLTGVLSQRLVRSLCNACKEEVPLSDDEKKIMEAYNFDINTRFKAVGCKQCFNVGHKGRTGIFELILLNDSIRDLVLKKASADLIRHQGLRDNMPSLLHDGLLKVAAGTISFEELLSVINE